MRQVLVIVALVAMAASPAAVFASPNDALFNLYQSRADLRAAFDPTTFRAVPGSAAGFLIDLEDWARQYGWQECPELSTYAPQGKLPQSASGTPPGPAVTADAFVVIDRATGLVLAASRADVEHPIASLTKLVTAQVVLESGVASSQTQAVLSEDDVDGAKLYVTSGDTFTVNDLFYAALVGSANNAANALARSTGLSRDAFVQAMNQRAAVLNLSHTRFADPTGIEVGNVSTAREMARLAETVFARREIRSYASTAARDIRVLNRGTVKHIVSTNWMLWKPEFDAVYVTSGKTGYLDEAGWNLVVSLRPSAAERDRELLLVLFGADSRADSFADARALANWTWISHRWVAITQK